MKSSLAVEKYHIPRMRIDVCDRVRFTQPHHEIPRSCKLTHTSQMEMDTTFFRTFFVENEALTKPATPLPSEFDKTSPVVTLELFNRQAGEILGVSKVKGGNRYSTVELAAMCIVFRPTEGKATVWLTV